MTYKRIFDEGIFAKDDELIFDYSSEEGVRVKLGTKKVKYKSYTTKIDGNLVFSLYGITGENKNILRALKGESSVKVNKKDLDYFLQRSALYAFHIISKEIDIILYSENSYYLFDRFIKDLSSKFSSKSLKIFQSIYKLSPSVISIKPDAPAKYLKDLEDLLKHLRKKEKIKLRNDIPLKFREYFTNFISIRDEVQSKIENKNILVVDDILTSGSTFSELFTILKLRKANVMYGLTLFKFL